jgi:hypothetical protein
MSAWGMLLIAIGGIVGSAAVNILIVGFYIGKYKEIVEECRNQGEESRKDLVKVREDVARIKGRINGKGWTQEA